MTRRLDRRSFLATGSRAGLGLSLLALHGCSQPERVPAGASTNTVDSGLIADLERLMPGLMAKASVPGLSLVVIRDAQVAWRRGFGVANATTGAPIADDTIFEAGSMSKAVFAYVVLKLCETGVLDLDRPLSRYTGERVVADDPRSDRLTTRHVLSHMSGLPNWRSRSEPMAFAFEPGERWSYSGEAYSYLQFIVSRLQGRVHPDDCGSYENDVKVCASDIDAYMRTRLLDPFEMTSGTYVWHETLQQRGAGAHDANGVLLQKGRTSAIDAARYGAAGGLFTTPTDYARFLIEVMAPKPADDWRMTPGHVADMLRPVVRVGEAPPHSWALGWQILHAPVGDAIAHGGSNPGFQAYAAASVARRTGLVVMTNGDRGFEIINEITSGAILQQVLGQD
jgi:CubicO group peptidase (beta-lactamase class C family)